MKYGLAVSLLLILVMAWYFTQEAPQTERVGEEYKETGLTPEKIVESDVNKPEADEPLPDIMTANQVERPLPDGQLFHPDPIIDALIGMVQFSACHKFFSKEEQNQQKLADMSEKQKKYLKPHFEDCELKEEQAKDYSQSRLMYQLGQLGQNKSLRQKYQSLLFDQSELSANEAAEHNQEISQLTGVELLISIGFYKRYFQHEVLPLIKTELQAHDMNMVNYVTTQAMALIACERGIDCSATSPMMFSRCLDYKNACGLDFKTYINKHYTPGIRNEILITTDLLKNLFNFN